MKTSLLIFAIALLLPVAGRAAGDMPAPPQNFTHRKIGRAHV